MKKKFGFIAAMMCAVMVLGGCGKDSATGNDATVSSETEQVQDAETESVSEEASAEIAETEESSEESNIQSAEESIEASATAEIQEVGPESIENAEPTEESKEEETMESTQAIIEETEPYKMPVNAILMRKGVKYGQMKQITYESKTTGTVRKANIILPAGYSEDQEYPVLYLLHGIGGDHNEWKGGMPEKVVPNAAADGNTRPMIVVMPNVRARANDAGNPADTYSNEHFLAFDNFINDLRDDLMPYMEANYSVATGKENTAIAGLSMGGRESLYIGLTMPETFGYIGSFTPAPGLLGGQIAEADFKLPEGSDNYIMIMAGKQDGVVREFPKTYSDALTKNGVEHVFYETEGGHEFSVWKNGLYNFVKNIFPAE